MGKNYCVVKKTYFVSAWSFTIQLEMSDILVWKLHKQITKLEYGSEHVMGLPAYEVIFQRPVGRCKCMA